MLVEIKGLKKHFVVKKGFWGKPLKHVKAVDCIDLSMNQGENMGLVGESGSGKSTVARLMVQLYQADEGSIILGGQDVVRLSSSRMRGLRHHIQMVFQDPYGSLDPRFTVRGILKEADALMQGASGREGRLDSILKAVGLAPECLERYPHEFSGGERQRIAIARALLMKPKVLILDEAVSSLDVLIQGQIIRLLKDLQAQFDVTYFFISHNLRVVKSLCQRIAVMYKGKIVEVADTQELFDHPLHPYTQELLAAALDYQSRDRVFDENIGEKSCLADRGNGHFVID